MKLISLNCNHCGAPLEVPDDARFVTCQFCESKLAVEHTGSAHFTKVLEEIGEKTDRLAGDVERLKRGDVIERLDREWELQREDFMVSGKHGRRSIPTKGESVIGGVVIAAFGTFWTVMAGGIGLIGGQMMPGPIGGFAACFPLFGVLFVVLGLYKAFSAYQKAEGFDRAQRRYKDRRTQLLREMDE